MFVYKYFVNIRQSTSGGDDTLMRGVTRGEGPEPYQNVHSAGYRGVYDFADPDSSVFIIATGQSEHPLSRHYDDDLGELWRRGSISRCRWTRSWRMRRRRGWVLTPEAVIGPGAAAAAAGALG